MPTIDFTGCVTLGGSLTLTLEEDVCQDGQYHYFDQIIYGCESNGTFIFQDGVGYEISAELSSGYDNFSYSIALKCSYRITKLVIIVSVVVFCSVIVLTIAAVLVNSLIVKFHTNDH